MRIAYYILFLFLSQPLLSQSIPIGNSTTTRAVIVGISDYQDERISDLKYAHKDADAFAEFLKSEAGLKLSNDNLIVLTNEQATTAQFDAALGWLLDESQEGDQVIIYFSGHGDVETKTRRSRGFLLCWDTPPQSYISGAMPVMWLQDVIETLELDNKSNVMIITDACRSGKLAGNAINGSQVTNANLAKQFASEIKILSCQPNEFSHEGEQWGGGRGAFSYHLIEGLYGMADRNSDLNISVSEIDRYLEDNVTAQVAPVSQIPMVLGNKGEIIGKVNETMLNALIERKSKNVDAFASVESKGLEDDILAKLDDETKKKYNDYKLAIKQKFFFNWYDLNRGDLNQCADDLFNDLMISEELKPLHNHIKRNYAAALQDDAQQFYNSKMKGDLSAVGTSRLIEDNKRLQTFPNQLERAAELIGDKHYMYKNLKAKAYYFKAVSGWYNGDNDAKSDIVLENLNLSLKWQPDMALTQCFLAFVYANFNIPDSATHYVQSALELSPSWILPPTSVADVFVKQKKYKLANQMMNIAWQIDSSSVYAINTNAKIKDGLKDKKGAERLFKKAIQLEPNWARPYKNLSYLYLTQARYSEAEAMALKAIQYDENQVRARQVLAWSYIYTDRPEKAEQVLLKALDLDANNTFKIDWDLSCYYSRQNEIEKCFESLERLLEKGFKRKKDLRGDLDLKNARNEKERWDALINKYFSKK